MGGNIALSQTVDGPDSMIVWAVIASTAEIHVLPNRSIVVAFVCGLTMRLSPGETLNLTRILKISLLSGSMAGVLLTGADVVVLPPEELSALFCCVIAGLTIPLCGLAGLIIGLLGFVLIKIGDTLSPRLSFPYPRLISSI